MSFIDGYANDADGKTPLSRLVCSYSRESMIWVNSDKNKQ